MANPARTNGLEIRNVDDQVLVHDAAHDKVHVLNRTAGMILNMCDGNRSPTEIARVLSDATGTDISVVILDVDAIIRDFTSLQLVFRA
jgi:precorrin-6B methylase 1